MRYVVVPCRNEVESIGGLVRGILREGADGIVVADDGSTDATVRVAAEAGAVVCSVPRERRGLSAVYRAGLERALADGATTVVEMDAGGSHDPCELPRFWHALDKGAEVAAGCRFAHGGSYRGEDQRRALSEWGTLLTNLVHGTHFRDATSGYVGYAAGALVELLREPWRAAGHYYQTEVRLRAVALGLNFVEVPISYVGSSSSLNWKSIAEALRLTFLPPAMQRFGGRP